jgi:hypothetical protein
MTTGSMTQPELSIATTGLSQTQDMHQRQVHSALAEEAPTKAKTDATSVSIMNAVEGSDAPTLIPEAIPRALAKGILRPWRRSLRSLELDGDATGDAGLGRWV